MSGCCGINKSKYKSIQINKLNLNVIAIGFVLWNFDQSYIFFKFPVFPNISTFYIHTAPMQDSWERQIRSWCVTVSKDAHYVIIPLASLPVTLDRWDADGLYLRSQTPPDLAASSVAWRDRREIGLVFPASYLHSSGQVTAWLPLALLRPS